MKAWLNLRYTNDKRAALFKKGIQRHGYQVEFSLPAKIGSKDIFVTWNRIGRANSIAKDFERAGCKVLVTENSSWGNSFAGFDWYHIARNRHNTAGMFPLFDLTRWDALNVELQPFRLNGETVILPQRGIGSQPTAMPRGWQVLAQKKHGGRIRRHPGKHDGIPLDEDLAKCGTAITWGSGAAIKALMMGVKVISYMPDWIGSQDNTESDRLRMFRELACAQWKLDEIKSGYAFEVLL